MDGLSLEEFLKQHPICCFCGGATKATTRDHVPSRQLFDDRRWPEGFIFPACVSCNEGTRLIEQEIAFISRLFPDGPTEAHREEFEKIAEAIRNNSLEFLEELSRVSRAKKIRKLKELGLYGTAEGEELAAHMLRFNGPLVERALHLFATKLFFALHYRHTEKIVPPTGGVMVFWDTNFSWSPEKYEQLLTMLPTLEGMSRGKRDLTEQFSYRYAIGADGAFAMYSARFRETFILNGYVKMDASGFPEIGNWQVLKPFSANTGKDVR